VESTEQCSRHRRKRKWAEAEVEVAVEVGWGHLYCWPQDGAAHLLFCSLTALEMRQVATARAAKIKKEEKLRQWANRGWSSVKMLMPMGMGGGGLVFLGVEGRAEGRRWGEKE